MDFARLIGVVNVAANRKVTGSQVDRRSPDVEGRRGHWHIGHAGSDGEINTARCVSDDAGVMVIRVVPWPARLSLPE